MMIRVNVSRKNVLVICALICSLCSVFLVGIRLLQVKPRKPFKENYVYQVRESISNENPDALSTNTIRPSKPEDLHSRSSKSHFLLKPELTGATVLTRSETTWSRDDGSCEGDKSFVKVPFYSPAGMTPLYIHPENTDQHVSLAVLRGGVWEENYVTKIYNILKAETDLQFLDIGANIGVFGITMAKLGRKVVLVDPLLTDVQKMCNSVRDANFSDVYVLHNALSSERRPIGFQRSMFNVGRTYIRNMTSQDEETAFAILLDDLLEVFNFTSVAMKMDVELHELKVLQGANTFFSKVDVKYLMIEWLPTDKEITGKSIIDFLTRYKMAPYHPTMDIPLDIKDYKHWPEDVFWKKTT